MGLTIADEHSIWVEKGVEVESELNDGFDVCHPAIWTMMMPDALDAICSRA